MPFLAGLTNSGTRQFGPHIFSQAKLVAQLFRAGQPAFCQGAAEWKKPGKYLSKLNQHVSHIPISISGPSCELEVAVPIFIFKKISTGRGHFSPNACPQKMAVHKHSVSCMASFSFRSKQHEHRVASLTGARS